tara:strand:- start:1023 stop:2537 length:1515 start_codon:yes stop_codon:yes gene_type:complete
MKDFKYKTIFSSTIKPLVSEEKDKYLALASLADIGDFIPNVDTDENVDLLPIAFNACVVNRVNKNGDVIDTETAAKIYENFVNKPINIEHNRERVVGVILTAGFSEFGTDRPLDLEKVSKDTGPFNITLGGVFWKVVNNDLAELIEEASDPTSDNYMAISASWELGFSDFNIILLKNEDKNIENGEIIAGEEDIEKLQDRLKAFGGSEEVDENTKCYRQVVGEVVPLGIGLTENPAADVMGVIVESKAEEKTEDKEEEKTLAKTPEKINNISQNDEKNVISKENTTTMKIKSVNDITNDLLQTVEASVVADFIEEELKQASEKYAEESDKLKADLEESREQRETLSKEHEDLKTKLTEVEKTLVDLEEEKAKREAEAKFNERMSLLDEEYELNDEDREVIASDIKDMDKEGFESYQKKISVLLKSKSKAAIKAQAEAEEAKAEENKKLEETKASEEEVKENVVETAVDEAEKVDGEIPNSIQAEDESLMDKYRKAFDLDQFELK